MNKVKKTKLYTILLHSLIVIGAGHGIGIMGIFDVIGIIQIPEIYENGIKYNINGEYQDRLSLVVIFSIIGKILLITSLFIDKIKNLTRIIINFYTYQHLIKKFFRRFKVKIKREARFLKIIHNNKESFSAYIIHFLLKLCLAFLTVKLCINGASAFSRKDYILVKELNYGQTSHF